MATTYEAIATVEVGSGGAASISFTSIPGTYTDLLIKLSARGSASGNWIELDAKFNASSSNFTSRYLYGFDTTIGSATYTDQIAWITGASAIASIFGNTEIYIPNYASANNKSVSADIVTENNSVNGLNILNAQLWSNSAAITSIELTPTSGTLNQYSTATLYGIKNS